VSIGLNPAQRRRRGRAGPQRRLASRPLPFSTKPEGGRLRRVAHRIPNNYTKIHPDRLLVMKNRSQAAMTRCFMVSCGPVTVNSPAFSGFGKGPRLTAEPHLSATRRMCAQAVLVNVNSGEVASNNELVCEPPSDNMCGVKYGLHLLFINGEPASEAVHAAFWSALIPPDFIVVEDHRIGTIRYRWPSPSWTC